MFKKNDENNDSQSKDFTDQEEDYSAVSSQDESYYSDEESDGVCTDPEYKNYDLDRIKVKLLKGEEKEYVFLKEGGGLRFVLYNKEDGYDKIFERISRLYFPSIFFLLKFLKFIP